MIKLKGRIWALVVKEILALLQDPKGRLVLIAPPILQLILFSFAATLDVTNISLIIFNQDSGRHGYELVHRISGSSVFSKVKFVNNVNVFRKYIDRQKALAAVHIPQDFSRNLESGTPSKIQIILDGRRSNTAQIVSGYITQLAVKYGQELQSLTKAPTKIVIVNRNWFNENLIYLWFTVPALVCTLAMVTALIVTALSIARERELGTFDQVLVSPLMPYEILLGKMIPAVIIALSEGLFIWSIAVFGFKIPFTGSVPLLLFFMFIFIMSIVGIGLFISSFSRTQQQAILGTFVFMVPAVSLSGHASPVENMPAWLQAITAINPLKYAHITIRGLFLKDMNFADVISYAWPVALIGVATCSSALYFFSKRLE